MKRIVFILLFAAGLVLSGCGVTVNLGDVVRGSGNVKTESRDVSGFTQVAIEGSGDARISKSDHDSLQIEAEDNILPLITTTVQNGKLTIGFKNNTSISTSRPIYFTITVKDLTGVEVDGSANINVGENLQTSSMALIVRGSGDINIFSLQASSVSLEDMGSGNITINGGKVTDQQINVSGSGTFTAPDLESQTASVTVSGSGNVTLWAKSTLNASISGSGNVSYFGSPTVTKSVSGSGSLTGKGAK